jgi:sigma-B regulation protein RsbU (phosphoserine phosphatase)
MNVLLVDDDRIALELLARELLDWGYHLFTADNGLSAWELFQQHEFSIVISDWLMPEMDGLELIDRIRAAGSSQYVYCILLTVRSQLDDLIQGMEAGADDFLSKPFEPAELRVRLRAGQRIIELERRLSLANRRMRHELSTAASIQRSLLPVRTQSVIGSNFAWGYRPCDELGGDILNVISLGDEQLALYLLDVSGHGVSAALLSVALSRLLTTASNASSLIREKRDDSPRAYRVVPPAEVLARLNERFYRDMGGERFFTIIYGVLDLRTQRLCYASGGHNPALVLGANGEAKKLGATGPVLGILEDAEFDECQVQLTPHDRLLVYSDGITEAASATGEQFGIDRLISVVQEPRTRSMQESLDELVRRVEEWSQPAGLQDDVSCLAAQTVHASPS